MLILRFVYIRFRFHQSRLGKTKDLKANEFVIITVYMPIFDIKISMMVKQRKKVHVLLKVIFNKTWIVDTAWTNNCSSNNNNNNNNNITFIMRTVSGEWRPFKGDIILADILNIAWFTSHAAYCAILTMHQFFINFFNRSMGYLKMCGIRRKI